MTTDEFGEIIENLRPQFDGKDLEEYLLAIYKILNDNKDVYLTLDVTLELVAGILEKAITYQPEKFNKEWLAIIEPPSTSRLGRKFTNKTLNLDEIDKTIEYNSYGMEYTLDVLCFQIAELHKMREKQLKDEYRYFGINSETGHRWYNFDPYMSIECGLRCMDDNEDSLEKLDWSFIGNLLEDGRVYE